MLRIRIEEGAFSPEDVERAAAELASGGVGVIPTDTVYGIAALASNEAAVGRVLRIKERPPGKPLPVQVASLQDANAIGIADSPAVAALAGRFWPGPLTIVMERRPGVELPFQDPATIGVRVPASPLCIALIEKAGRLVVPSANAPGRPAPVTPSLIPAELLEAVDFLVDAGRCPLGVESTVVDVTGGVRVVREGAIPGRDVDQAAGGE